MVSCQADVNDPPKPAAGHHDSTEYPELDTQQVPQHDDWNWNFDEEDALDAPDAPDAPDWDPPGAELDEEEAATRSREPDCNKDAEAATRCKEEAEDPKDPPIEPWCQHLHTAAAFGLDDVTRKYLKLSWDEMDDLVALFRVQFKEEGLMAKVAKISVKGGTASDAYLESLVSDATLLRVQHSNLVKRRQIMLAEMGTPEPTSQALADKYLLFIKKHQRDFEKTEAQMLRRRHDCSNLLEKTGWVSLTGLHRGNIKNMSGPDHYIISYFWACPKMFLR